MLFPINVALFNIAPSIPLLHIAVRALIAFQLRCAGTTALHIRPKGRFADETLAAITPMHDRRLAALLGYVNHVIRAALNGGGGVAIRPLRDRRAVRDTGLGEVAEIVSARLSDFGHAQFG